VVGIVEGVVSIDGLFLFDAEQIGDKLVVFKTIGFEFSLQVVIVISEGRIVDCGLHKKLLEVAPEKDALGFEIRSRLIV
jgi:hypothetical protein